MCVNFGHIICTQPQYYLTTQSAMDMYCARHRRPCVAAFLKASALPAADLRQSALSEPRPSKQCPQMEVQEGIVTEEDPIVQTVSAVDSLLRVICDKLPQISGVPRCHKSRMKTPTESVPLRVAAPGNYAHYGIQNYMLNVTGPSILAREEIVIDIGIDGAPLANCSALQAWPIMGYIVTSDDPVFDIGLYVGMKKPESAFDLLKMQQQICGTFGRRRIFCTIAGRLRTDQSFSLRADPEHHAQKHYREVDVGSKAQPVMITIPILSVLEEAGHKLVSDFPIDPMHLVDQGCGKMVLNCLLNRNLVGGPNKPEQILAMKREFEAYCHYTPSEFARTSRVMEEVLRFKATEVRKFLLYTRVVLLKQFLAPDAYIKFLKLSLSYRLIDDVNLQVAEEMLQEFVSYFTHYHNLLRLVGDVRIQGPLPVYSCYKFEDRIRQINRLHHVAFHVRL